MLRGLFAGDDPLDPFLDLVGVGRIDVALPEHVAAGVGVVVAEQVLEGEVRRAARLPPAHVPAASDDAALRVDHADRAGRVVRDRVEEVALAPLLLLEQVAVGAVEPARDDAHHPAALVEHRRAVPVHDHALAAHVGERVLVLGRRELGGRRLEARDHLLALGLVDEDLPEVPADDVLLVLVSARPERREIELEDAAVDVDVGEQARSRVGESSREPHLGPELGLEPLVLEREPRRDDHGVDVAGAACDRAVVRDRRDLLAVELDELHAAARRRRGLDDPSALRVDPARTSEAATRIEPVDDLEGGVAEGADEHITKGSAVQELGRDLG